jgi:hypothetical protein
MPLVNPEDEEWDEIQDEWIYDPEGIALVEQWTKEEEEKALKALEDLFGPEEAKQFIARELGRAEGEAPWPETPGSRALTVLGKITMSPNLRKRIEEIVERIISQPRENDDESA